MVYWQQLADTKKVPHQSNTFDIQPIVTLFFTEKVVSCQYLSHTFEIVMIFLGDLHGP